MSFVCFNRIAVTGPRPAVLRFRGDARRRRPSVVFSLETLFRKNRLAAPSSDGIPGDEGHYDASASRLTQWHGYTRIEYRLEVKNYEVYELLVPLSRSYGDLCFVDSEISLDSGEINGRYIARGRCSTWPLPEDRCNAHWERAAKKNSIETLEDAYEDDSVRNDAEEAMLAEAMARWDKRVLLALRGRSLKRAAMER